MTTNGRIAVRITDVTTIELCYEMSVPMADAVHFTPERPALLVQVHTDQGTTGLGKQRRMEGAWRAPRRSYSASSGRPCSARSLKEDVERVRLAREAVRPGVGLAIDVNSAWIPSIALQFMREVESFKISWLEEPVATDDVEGSAMVAQQLPVPVAGYETETGLLGFRHLIERRAVDIVQPDVIWTGGSPNAGRWRRSPRPMDSP